MLVAYPMIGGF